MNLAEAERRTILRAEVGSTLHGVAIGGQDDRDEMGVCVEPPEFVLGLRLFDQVVHRTQPEGVRSGPGDLDLVIYSLRKYCRLAARGNPTVLLLLFAPADFVRVETPLGRDLRELAPAFVSQHAGRAFLGYMTQQRERLVGDRGQKAVKRPELEAAYGFDTKYAGHMLRLGYQGREYLTTQRLTLPMPEPERELIRAVRRGEVPLPDVLKLAGELERDLKAAMDETRLPAEPAYDRINGFLVTAHRRHWGERGE